MSVEQTRGRLDCGTAGRGAGGQRGALPRRPHLRHHRHEEAEAGGRGADVPRLAHAHARDEPERQGEPLRLRIRHGHGASRPKSWRAVPARTRRTIRTRRSSASTSSRCRSPRPEKARIVSRPRIFADPTSGAISGLWPGGDHGPGTQKTSRRPTSATTSPSSRRSAWPPAPARATASCSTSRIR